MFMEDGESLFPFLSRAAAAAAGAAERGLLNDGDL